MSQSFDASPHRIRRHDVSAWLADSAVKVVTFHRTSFEAAEQLRDQGVDLSASRIAAFGEGFYSATVGDPLHGPAEVQVAVRTRHPLVGTLDEVADLVDGLARLVSPRDPRITPEVARGIRRHLLDLGYDGIVVWDGGGDGIDYVVAIVEGTVKVVVD